jgi:quinoprotein dehydrogenase-associated probable ABC transporter substrate-binding protein
VNVLIIAAAVVTAVAAPTRPFRVCADPNDLPNSDRAERGYENRIAALVAHDLGDTVEYTWYPQMRGFVRKTLNTGVCDVIMGVPAHYDPVLTTAPYFRTSYALVYRADRGLHITSLDDPKLRSLRIGVHVIGDDYQNTPAATALAARGIVDRVVGFPIVGDYGQASPRARVIDAVARGTIDVAIVWGPLAGYFATRERVPLTVVPLGDRPDSSGAVFAFDIAVGVRRRDTALAATIDSVLERERPAIRRILHDYGVPVLDEDGTGRSSDHAN